MIVIFSALKEEVSSLKGRLAESETAHPDTCRIYKGQIGSRDCLLVLTGVGKARALAAAREVLDLYPVSLVISTGFAGGLNRRTAFGHTVIYQNLASGDGAALLYSDKNLVALSRQCLQDCVLSFIEGTGISRDELCSKPEDKLKLGKASGADAVDMESYWICEAAAQRHIPFLAVRVIFDACDCDISHLQGLSSQNGIKFKSVLRHIVSHPGSIGELNGLRTSSHKAESSLALFLTTLLERIQR